jgi:iron(III) transport system permease protein
LGELVTIALNRFFSPRFWSDRRQFLLPGAVTLFVVMLVLVPLIALIIFSFRSGTPWTPGPFTLENYDIAYSDPQTYTILFNTGVLAVLSTAMSIVIAVAFAFLTERTDMPYRNVAWALMLIPMAMPGLLFAVSWTFLLSPRIGAFNVWIRDFLSLFGVGMEEGPFNIYSMTGMVFLEGLRGVTTTFLIMVGAFRAMDPSLEEAARTAGASNFTTFRIVSLPILTPAIMAAGIYSFMTHLESLEIPIVIGLPAKVFVFPSYIYFTTQRYTPPQYGLAAALGATFIIISIVLVWWYRRVVGQSNKYATVTGKGYRPRVIKLGNWRYAFFSAFAFYFVLTIGAPALALVWSSLLPIPMAPSFELIDSLSLQNFYDVFDDDEIWQSFGNTLIVAVAAGTLTMVLSLTIAWVVVRMRSKVAGTLDTIAFLPHSVPGVVIGIALIFVSITPPFSYLGLYGTLTIVVIGMTISYLSFGSRTMNGALTQIHLEMEEAAMAAGVRWRVILTRIVLPLLLPAFIGGWIWVATHAMRNFSIPLLLAGRDNRMISVVMWHAWDDGFPGITTAIGVLLIILLTVLTVAGRWAVMRLNRQQDN